MKERGKTQAALIQGGPKGNLATFLRVGKALTKHKKETKKEGKTHKSGKKTKRNTSGRSGGMTRTSSNSRD